MNKAFKDYVANFMKLFCNAKGGGLNSDLTSSSGDECINWLGVTAPHLYCMKIAWISFELCAGMEMAMASIDEACPIKVARRRILDQIRLALNIGE